MNRFTTTMPIAALFAACAVPVAGQVTFTDNASTLQASALAGISSPFAIDLDNPPLITFSETGIPSTFGDTLTANASAGGGNSTADFSATIGVDITQAAAVVTVDSDLSYDASQTAAAGNPEFDRANAEGSAVIDLVFDLDMDYNYTFDATAASASGTAQLELRLDVISGGQGFDIDLQNQTQDISFSGFLPAGSGYKLVINVDDSDNLGSVNGQSASSLVTLNDAMFVLTPVPEPTSLALLSLGGLLVARRRRS